MVNGERINSLASLVSIAAKRRSLGTLRYVAALIEVEEVLLTLETGDRQPIEDLTLGVVISARSAN